MTSVLLESSKAFKKFFVKVDEVKTEVKFFNNYILDPERPQIPEEKVLPMVRIFVIIPGVF